MIRTRRLAPSESGEFRALWLQGLQHEPQAFLLTEAEAAAIPEPTLATMMAKNSYWGAFNETGALVAFAALRRGAVERLRHTGDVGPLYVHPSSRRNGVARALLLDLLKDARAQGMLQVELAVDQNNSAAIALYEALGFRQFGLRPRSVIIAGEARNDLLMLRCVDTNA